MVKRTDKNIIVGLDIGTRKWSPSLVRSGGPTRSNHRDRLASIARPEEKAWWSTSNRPQQSIQRAVEEAELMAGVEIDAVYAGIAGSHIPV